MIPDLGVASIEEIKPKITKSKKKKGNKNSTYKETKIYPHSTINGKGKIANLTSKGNLK